MESFFTWLVEEKEEDVHLPPLPQNTPVSVNAKVLNDRLGNGLRPATDNVL